MARTRMIGWTLLLMLVAVNLAACASMGGDPPPTLYKRLGGREGIALVVGDFVTNMAQDSRVNARFKDMKPADVEKLKSNIADQICDATGGPCSYLGRDMKTTHQGMKITEAEWTATVENFSKALDKNQISVKDKSEVLGMLGPMKADIVGR